MAIGKSEPDFTYSFPAIRGIQAGREYYVAMCPLKLIPVLFRFDEDDLPPELRAQRTLNKSRVPSIAQYVIENPENYIFSSLTASIGGEVDFNPFGSDEVGRKIGTLTIPMETQFLINDGQHRRAAIEKALAENPSLSHETISVVFFVDAGLKRSQQMFADLNRYAVRTTRSLGVLYDHRDPVARLCSHLIKTVPVYKGMTETARSTISNRSRKLFTLSSIYQATKRLLRKKDSENISKAEERLAREFWVEVSKYMPDWRDALDRKVAPSELRRDYVHAHGIALQALAIAGSSLIEKYPDDWKTRLAKIKLIDWSRENAILWEGRALVGGRLSKAQNNVILTSNIIKKTLGLTLDPNEKQIEGKYAKGQS